jgi:hypothetical protein
VRSATSCGLSYTATVTASIAGSTSAALVYGSSVRLAVSALLLVLPILPVITVAACAGSPPHGESPSRGAHATADAALNESVAPPPDAGSQAEPALPTAAYAGRRIETACNGKDDDDDGFVDVLLPVGPNACSTGAKGACGSGFSMCEGEKRTCVAPPPMPEVADGIDNDCNGIVDDVPAASVRPRAVLLAPKYAWADAAPDIANVTASMAQAGIPLDRPKTGSDWASVATLDDYALAVVPGYLLGSVLPKVREKLEAFVERGGVLVVFKPIGDADHPEALALAGLRAGARHRDIEELRFAGASSPATLFVDSPEERTLGVNAKGDKAGVEVWTFEPDPGAKTEVLASAFRDGVAVGPSVTRRRLGKGSVYAIGHDLASFGSTRCYINCFEAAGDAMRLVFDGALREGSQGHVALLATAPALASSVLVLTHDVNTHEAQFPGAWGEAGAVQFAKIEKQRGVSATFYVMTNYRAGELNAKMVKELCGLGMCPAGTQGVARVPHFPRMGDGMVRVSENGPWKCKETLPTYGTPSLCGEVFLSSQLVQSSGGGVARTWRSPYLAYHPELIQILASAGIRFDSSFGVGDLPYNVPLDMATTGIQQRRFHRRPILEFPLTCDDGIDVVRDKVRERVELQPSTEARFRSLWEYIALQNLRNSSFTTLRVNPVRGEKMTAENVLAKAQILGRFLDDLARSHPDIAVRSVQQAGDFWRARLDATLDARFDADAGYAGTITIGKTTAPGLTIELGDAIKSFDCAKCGETKVAGKRVALLTALPPGTKLEFTAKVR